MITDFINYNTVAKTKINQELKTFFKKKKVFSGLAFWKEDISTRFLDFCRQGKAVRGTLVMLATQIFADKPVEGTESVAAALEILHSSLLIHDDFMDQDLLRRGQPTFVKQYAVLLNRKVNHDSTGLAICAGDIGFFLGFNMLVTNSKLSPTQKQKLVELFAGYMEEVGLAQMQDIWFAIPGHQPKSSRQILDMYRSKTGHYTFSLPLITGSILAGKNNLKLSTQLRKLGGLFGLVFQIQDDLLGIYGETSQIGKPSGSDIAAGKFTLLYSYFLNLALPNQKKILQAWFGNNKQLSKSQLTIVRKLFISSGAVAEINKLTDSTNKRITKLIDLLPIDADKKKILLSLSEYNLSRQK